jgi:hypothetical protein
MPKAEKSTAVQVHPHGFSVGLLTGVIPFDDRSPMGNPYLHVCRVMHKRGLLAKPQLKAALWFTISELHAEKGKDQNNPAVDRALAACAAALEEVSALPDDNILNVEPRLIQADQAKDKGVPRRTRQAVLEAPQKTPKRRQRGASSVRRLG